MPDSKKDSQRIRQTYNLTQGHREPARNASARLCAQQLSAQPWTTWPYWWSLWWRSSTRSDSLHLPLSLSLTSISNMLVSDGTCAPIATLRLSQINSLIGGHFSCTLFSVNGGQENGREGRQGMWGWVLNTLLCVILPTAPSQVLKSATLLFSLPFLLSVFFFFSNFIFKYLSLEIQQK